MIRGSVGVRCPYAWLRLRQEDSKDSSRLKSSSCRTVVRPPFPRRGQHEWKRHRGHISRDSRRPHQPHLRLDAIIPTTDGHSWKGQRGALPPTNTDPQSLRPSESTGMRPNTSRRSRRSAFREACASIQSETMNGFLEDVNGTQKLKLISASLDLSGSVPTVSTE